MLRKCRALLLLFIYSTAVNADFLQKLRMCVVDGKGGFQKTDNFCPTLANGGGSLVECVEALDRFECLRKMRKGFADYSIFTSEDLITAMNTETDMLITTELRISKDTKFQEEVVLVVSKHARIESTHDLKDKILCHPGYGSDGFVSEILANFLEATIVTKQSCEPTLTLPENKIRSSSQYFKSACKPGLWVNDPDVDRELKKRYPNLCMACSNPYACSEEDKYYGTSGSLLCLTDGAGDISWTTLGQVQLQFNLSNPAEISDYQYLCRDDKVMPLDTPNPCIWVAKPWPVIATKKGSVPMIQTIMPQLDHNADWKGAVLELLEVVNYHIVVHTLNDAEAIDTYLNRIPGYLNANSFASCQPPRTVKICTTSIPAQYKCGWMREAAAVQGLEPDIDCIKADNETQCMEALRRNLADVVIVHPDYLNTAINEYKLKTLFYETVHDDGKYLTVAVVPRDSNIKTFEDMKGKKACFPLYDGVSWNTIVDKLYNEGKLEGCYFEKAMENYFGDSCVPGIPSNYSAKLAKLCRNETLDGDMEALMCLKEGGGDVAFVSQNNFRKFLLDKNNINVDFRVVCDENPCHLSWSPPAQAMVAQNISAWRQKDILDVFLELDNLFGKNFKEQTRMFTMYGKFDERYDVLFNDNTVQLRKSPSVKDYNVMARLYPDILKDMINCRYPSSSIRYVPSTLGIFIVSVVVFLF